MARHRPRKAVSFPSPSPCPQEDDEEELPPLQSGSESEGEEEEKTCSRVTHERGAADGPPPVTYTLYEHLIKLLEVAEKLELLAVRLVGGERQLQLRLRVNCQGVKGLVSVLVDSGGQVSLVRTGLFPASCIKTSPNPVRLKVSNGQYMGGGRTEVHFEMEFLNHEELSRPDKGKRVTLGGTFYEADMDWDVIIGYDFMPATATGVQPAQSSMTLYKDDRLSWLSAHLAFEESHWAHAEREQLCRAVRAVKPCQRPLDEYGFTFEAFQEVVAGLGAGEPSVDAFSSAYSESLQLCKTYWHTKDSAWFKRWDELFRGLLWIHCNP